MRDVDARLGGVLCVPPVRRARPRRRLHSQPRRQRGAAAQVRRAREKRRHRHDRVADGLEAHFWGGF